MHNSELWKQKTTKFLTAQTISLLGSSLVQYAIIWYITLRTSSGSMMAVATLCGYLPQIVLSLFAGVWIDRYDRKWMSMLSDGLIALSTLVAALLFLAGYNDIWLLFVVLIVRSLGTGVQMPVVNAIIPQLVPADKLLKVNGISSTINAVMMFMSPALSGMILSVTTIEMTFFIDVITAVIGIGIMFGIDIPPYQKLQSNEDVAGVLKEVKQGIRYLLDSKVILQLMIFIALGMILISPSAFLTPLLVARSFGSEVWRLSVSEMSFSLGAAVGGLFLSLRCQKHSHVQAIVVTSFAYGTLMILLGWSPYFWIYLIFNFLIGITIPNYNAPLSALLQEEVHPGMHGRIFSLLQIVTACTLPLGSAVFGPLADVINIGSILIVCGLLLIVWTCYNLKKLKSLSDAA